MLVVVWEVGGGAVFVVVVVVGGAMVGEGVGIGVVGIVGGEEVEFRRVDVVPVPVPAPGLGLGVC